MLNLTELHNLYSIVQVKLWQLLSVGTEVEIEQMSFEVTGTKEVEQD